MMHFGVAAGVFSAVLNNYLYEILAIDRVGRGVVESPHEPPGLMHAFTEKRMLRTAFIVSAGGLLMLFFWGTARI